VSSIFPFRSRAGIEPSEGSYLVEITDETADEVFSALGSATARDVLAELYDEPQTASSLSESTDITVQNAKYHIDKLLDAELIRVADTWYSENGREMKVYAPRNRSLVVFAADDSTSFRKLIRRTLGAVGLLGLGGLLIDRMVRSNAGPTPTDQGAIVGGDAAGSGLWTVQPGLLFFVGGLFALALVLLWWFLRRDSTFAP